MSYACVPILVGVTSPVPEILLLSKTAKFPFPTMDYSPWSSKNSIDRNRLKNFIQVRIDELCMCTNFGGCGLSGFGVMAPFCLPSKGPLTLYPIVIFVLYPIVIFVLYPIVIFVLYPIVMFCIISHSHFFALYPIAVFFTLYLSHFHTCQMKNLHCYS